MRQPQIVTEYNKLPKDSNGYHPFITSPGYFQKHDLIFISPQLLARQMLAGLNCLTGGSIIIFSREQLEELLAHFSNLYNPHWLNIINKAVTFFYSSENDGVLLSLPISKEIMHSILENEFLYIKLLRANELTAIKEFLEKGFEGDSFGSIAENLGNRLFNYEPHDFEDIIEHEATHAKQMYRLQDSGFSEGVSKFAEIKKQYYLHMNSIRTPDSAVDNFYRLFKLEFFVKALYEAEAIAMEIISGGEVVVLTRIAELINSAKFNLQDETQSSLRIHIDELTGKRERLEGYCSEHILGFIILLTGDLLINTEDLNSIDFTEALKFNNIDKTSDSLENKVWSLAESMAKFYVDNPQMIINRCKNADFISRIQNLAITINNKLVAEIEESKQLYFAEL